MPFFPYLPANAQYHRRYDYFYRLYKVEKNKEGMEKDQSVNLLKYFQKIWIYQVK